MNLLRDYAESLAAHLAADGYNSPAGLESDDPHRFLVGYYDGLLRRIQPRRRATFLSDRLRRGSLSESEWRSVQRLHASSEAGQDLRPYQSRDSAKWSKRDSLVYDWGIHHLHLGPVKPGHKWSGRSKYVLYALFAEAHAWFVAVDDHRSFSDIALLEVVESNWPELLEPHTLAGVLGVSPKIDSKGVHSLRKAGVQGFVQLGSGRALVPPGGGYSTAGTSLSSLRRADHDATLLKRAENVVEDNDASIRELLGVSALVQLRLVSMSERGIDIGASGCNNICRIPIEA